MRVLHVVASLDERTGGPAVALKGLALAQARHGLKVSVLSGWETSHGKPDVESLRSSDIHVEFIGPLSGFLKTTTGLRERLMELIRQCDVMHIHGVWEDLQYQAMKVARKLGRPYVVRPCGMLDPWSLSQGSFKKRLYFLLRLRRMLLNANALHATSMMEAHGLESLLAIRQILVEPNGLPLETYNVDATLQEQTPTIVYLGRLHEKKRPDLPIELLSRSSRSDTRLVLAGEGDTKFVDGLKKRVEVMGLGDRVEFPGHVTGEEKLRLLQQASLFILPSQQENFGIAVVEALACGTPVLVSDQVALADEIARAGVGIMLPLDSPDWQRVFDEKSSRKNWSADISARCRAFVEMRYGWEQIVSRWVTHYERMVAK